MEIKGVWNDSGAVGVLDKTSREKKGGVPPISKGGGERWGRKNVTRGKREKDPSHT